MSERPGKGAALGLAMLSLLCVVAGAGDAQRMFCFSPSPWMLRWVFAPLLAGAAGYTVHRSRRPR